MPQWGDIFYMISSRLGFESDSLACVKLTDMIASLYTVVLRQGLMHCDVIMNAIKCGIKNKTL